jgi:hypothetical protein
MMDKNTRLIITSQLSLLVMIILCVLLSPRFLFSHNEGGISNYGVNSRTVVPYSLAFGLSAGLLYLAAYELPKKMGERSRRAIYTTSATLLLAVLLTTYGYKTSALRDHLHTTATIVAFIFQMGAGIWIARSLRPGTLSSVLLVIQATTFLIVLLTFFGLLHFLFIAEVLTIFSYGSLLVRSSLPL